MSENIGVPCRNAWLFTARELDLLHHYWIDATICDAEWKQLCLQEIADAKTCLLQEMSSVSSNPLSCHRPKSSGILLDEIARGDCLDDSTLERASPFTYSDADSVEISPMNLDKIVAEGSITPPLPILFLHGPLRVPIDNGYTKVPTSPSHPVQENSGQDLVHRIVLGKCYPFAPAPFQYTLLPEHGASRLLQPNPLTPFDFSNSGLSYSVRMNAADIIAVGNNVRLQAYKDLQPSIDEMRYWRSWFRLPDELVASMKQSPPDIPALIGGYVRDNYSYFLNPALGKFICENADDLPLIVDTLRAGHCDILSWVSAALLRSRGIPAYSVPCTIPINKGTAFNGSYGHAICMFIQPSGDMQLFDPTTVVPQDAFLAQVSERHVDVMYNHFIAASTTHEKRAILHKFKEECTQKYKKATLQYPSLTALSLLPVLNNFIEITPHVNSIVRPLSPPCKKIPQKLPEVLKRMMTLTDILRNENTPFCNALQFPLSSYLSNHAGFVERELVAEYLQCAQQLRGTSLLLIDPTYYPTTSTLWIPFGWFNGKLKTATSCSQLLTTLRKKGASVFKQRPPFLIDRDGGWIPDAEIRECPYPFSWDPAIDTIKREHNFVDGHHDGTLIAGDIAWYAQHVAGLRRALREPSFRAEYLLRRSLDSSYLDTQATKQLFLFPHNSERLSRPQSHILSVPKRNRHVANLTQLLCFDEQDVYRVQKAWKEKINACDRSPARGTDTMWDEARTYAPGDDARLIDWNAFARLDKLYVRTPSRALDITSPIHVIFDVDFDQFESLCTSYFLLDTLKKDNQRTNRQIYITHHHSPAFFLLDKCVPIQHAMAFLGYTHRYSNIKRPSITSESGERSDDDLAHKSGDVPIILPSQSNRGYHLPNGKLPQNILYVSDNDLCCASATYYFGKTSSVVSVWCLDDRLRILPEANPVWVKKGFAR